MSLQMQLILALFVGLALFSLNRRSYGIKGSILNFIAYLGITVIAGYGIWISNDYVFILGIGIGVVISVILFFFEKKIKKPKL